jgi:2'-5' RNA ligase
LTSKAPARVRVFAALELPPELSRRLTEVISGLSKALPRGSVRWVRPEGIHLTLKFFGEVAPSKLADLQAGLAQAAGNAAPIALTLEGLGVFPNPLRPRVIWVGVAGGVEALGALYQAVEEATASLGFKPEARGFSPHLTLGRVNGALRPAERQALGEALRAGSVDRLGDFTADSLSLMGSELKPGGAVYTRLYSAPLGGRNPTPMLES